MPSNSSALHRAVFAEPAVQRDEAARKAVLFQLADVALGGVKRMGVHAAGTKRLQHAPA